MGLNYVVLARVIAEASKDPRYKIGAVIFDGKGDIRSTGYNGAPRGVEDRPERYQKPLKGYYVAHAEENAIVQAARRGVATEDCAILVWGKTVCATCARMIIQAGITTVLIQSEDYSKSSYKDSFDAANVMFHEAGVDVIFYGEQDVKFF